MATRGRDPIPGPSQRVFVGVEIFERVVSAGGQILNVERTERELAGVSDASAILVFTFEIGRIAVRFGARDRTLAVDLIASREELPPDLVSATEEEPWWRVLGAPLSQVSLRESDGERSIRLQFRPDEQHPRRVLLSLEEGGVRATLEADES